MRASSPPLHSSFSPSPSFLPGGHRHTDEKKSDFTHLGFPPPLRNQTPGVGGGEIGASERGKGCVVKSFRSGKSGDFVRSWAWVGVGPVTRLSHLEKRRDETVSISWLRLARPSQKNPSQIRKKDKKPSKFEAFFAIIFTSYFLGLVSRLVSKSFVSRPNQRDRLVHTWA